MLNLHDQTKLQKLPVFNTVVYISMGSFDGMIQYTWMLYTNEFFFFFPQS